MLSQLILDECVVESINRILTFVGLSIFNSYINVINKEFAQTYYYLFL